MELKLFKDKKRKQQPSTKNISFKVSNYLTVGFYFILFSFIILLTGFSINYYTFVKEVKSIGNFNIDYYEKTFYATITKFKKVETNNITEMKLKYYLIMNDFKELENFLKKIKFTNKKIYLKYYGILYFKQHKFNLSIKKLNYYLKKFGYDRDVISYLGNIYYNKNDFKKAITMYSKIKNDNFETAYNKAIIFEKNGNITNSLKFYKKAYGLVNDPLMKKRIYNKIYLIENYESKKN